MKKTEIKTCGMCLKLQDGAIGPGTDKPEFEEYRKKVQAGFRVRLCSDGTLAPATDNCVVPAEFTPKS